MNVRIRRINSVLLAVLLCLLVLVASLGLWAQRTVLNQSVFAQNTEEILATPEVLAAISAYVVDETFQALPQPPGSGASLIGELLRGTIERQVSRVLASEVVQTEVVKEMAVTHAQFVALLETEADTVVFDLGPVFRAVVTGLVGEGILSSTDLANSGIGKVYLYRSDSSEALKNSLQSAQRAVSLFHQVLLLTFLLIPVIGAAVVFVAPKRLSGLRNISISLLLASIFGILILRSGRRFLPNIVEGAANRSATRQIFDALTQNVMWFFIVSSFVAVLGIVLTVRKGALSQSLFSNSIQRQKT